VLHPAVAIAAAFILIAAAVAGRRTGIPGAARAGSAAAALVVIQLALGALNIVLLAPVWMQIVHLLAADLLWIALVVMALEAGRPR
jgi:heme A synthase